MASIVVQTAQERYTAVVERGLLQRAAHYLQDTRARIFIVTTADVWGLHGAALQRGLAGRDIATLFFPGGEERKRLSSVEALADEMLLHRADRRSIVIGFGGGIVTDIAGFLAAIFMRGVPVLQIPTTLLAQVDAGIGGKTGVNLQGGKNLMGSFHQPLAVLVDPDLLRTLPEREYRAGLYEIIKTGVIRSPALFQHLEQNRDAVLRQDPESTDYIIAESVRIKAEVVSSDEKEGGLRRILNFGHTIGHALEAETGYKRFLHGEAVAFGMRAATHLAAQTGYLSAADCQRILDVVDSYGPIPPVDGIAAEHLVDRLQADKKTVLGTIHFVLPTRIGQTEIVAGMERERILTAVETALHG